MKVLVTGAAGQLGVDLVRCLRGDGHQVVGTTLRELDLSKPDQIRSCLHAEQADWVCNCAAYTLVDKAEQEIELATDVNRDGAAAIAAAVAEYGGRLLQVSTDYVFNGQQCTPYREEDVPDPLSVYGRSKWEGEQAVLEQLPNAVLFRTAWVYGCHGHNFVKAMLRRALDGQDLRVVDDQIGTPTWTVDISRAISRLLHTEAQGTYHFTNEGVASWYDFTLAILAEAAKLGFLVQPIQVEPIPTEAYPTPAQRPRYSVMNKQKIREVIGQPIPYWRDSLVSMLKELKQCADCL